MVRAGGSDSAARAGSETVKPTDFEAVPSQAVTLAVTSQGDVAMRAALARSAFGVDGTGVGIGVLSNGVATLAARQAAGELPAVTVLPGQAGTGDEGTAMLEIVHDLAPGAPLYFATAFSGQASFAANIQALCNAGAKIIVDDVFYYAEAVFQDGIIAQGVTAARANGCHYFSSAGNSGNLTDATAGAWEGDFVAAASAPAGLSGTVQSFGGANSDPITVDPPSLITLQWSDAQGASSNDYDLYLLNSALTAVEASSTDSQTGTQDPFEYIDSGCDATGNVLQRSQLPPRHREEGGSGEPVSASQYSPRPPAIRDCWPDLRPHRR